MPWYSYVAGDPANPSSYIYCCTSSPACTDGAILCAVYAIYNVSNNPIPAAITTPLYADIKAALENQAHRGNAYVKS